MKEIVQISLFFIGKVFISRLNYKCMGSCRSRCKSEHDVDNKTTSTGSQTFRTQ